MLWSYFCYTGNVNNHRIDENGCIVNEDHNYTQYKQDKIEPCYKELEGQISSELKPLAKSFYFYNTSKAGQYLFSLLFSFNNLNLLNFSECTVPFTSLCELFKSSTNLETLVFRFVTFTHHEKDQLTLDSIKFPPKLKDLTFVRCKAIAYENINNDYDFLFKDNRKEEFSFTLSPTLIPSLLNFMFQGVYCKDNGFNLFLECNPQLEHLKSSTDTIDQIKLDIIEKSNRLKKLELFCEYEPPESIKIPTLNSIKQLILCNISGELYSFLEKICLSSPNLTELSIVINNIVRLFDYMNMSSALGSFCQEIIPSCSNLKTLEFSIYKLFSVSINLNSLSNIEKLLIESDYDFMHNIEFQNCSSLKLFKFKYYTSIKSRYGKYIEQMEDETEDDDEDEFDVLGMQRIFGNGLEEEEGDNDDRKKDEKDGNIDNYQYEDCENDGKDDKGNKNGDSKENEDKEDDYEKEEGETDTGIKYEVGEKAIKYVENIKFNSMKMKYSKFKSWKFKFNSSNIIGNRI